MQRRKKRSLRRMGGRVAIGRLSYLMLLPLISTPYVFCTSFNRTWHFNATTHNSTTFPGAFALHSFIIHTLLKLGLQRECTRPVVAKIRRFDLSYCSLLFLLPASWPHWLTDCPYIIYCSNENTMKGIY